MLASLPVELLYLIADLGDLTLADHINMVCSCKTLSVMREHSPIQRYDGDKITHEVLSTIPPKWLQTIIMHINTKEIPPLSNNIHHLKINNIIPAWPNSIKTLSTNVKGIRIVTNTKSMVEEVSCYSIIAIDTPKLHRVECYYGAIIGCNLETLIVHDLNREIKIYTKLEKYTPTVADYSDIVVKSNTLLYGGSESTIKHLQCNRHIYSSLLEIGLDNLNYLHITGGSIPDVIGAVDTLRYDICGSTCTSFRSEKIGHINNLYVDIIERRFAIYPVIYKGISKLVIEEKYGYIEGKYPISEVLIIEDLPNIKRIHCVGINLLIKKQPTLEYLHLAHCHILIGKVNKPIFESLHSMEIYDMSICIVRSIVAPKLKYLTIKLLDDEEPQSSLEFIVDAFPSLRYIKYVGSIAPFTYRNCKIA